MSAFDAILFGCSHHGYANKGYKLYNDLKKCGHVPNQRIISYLYLALARVKDMTMKRMFEIASSLQNDLEKISPSIPLTDTTLYNTLLEFFFRVCGLLIEYEEETKQRNTPFSSSSSSSASQLPPFNWDEWSTLISYASQNLTKMEEAGVTLDESSYSLWMKIIGIHRHKLQKKERWKTIPSLILRYTEGIKEESWDEYGEMVIVMSLFDRTRRNPNLAPDVKYYNTFLSVLVKSDRVAVLQYAKDLFIFMEKQMGTIDLYTIDLYIRVCAKLKIYDKVDDILFWIDRYKVILDTNLINGVIRLASRHVDREKGDRIVTEMLGKASSLKISFNASTYNVLLTHHAAHGRISECFRMFEVMEGKHGSDINVKTMNALANAATREKSEGVCVCVCGIVCLISLCVLCFESEDEDDVCVCVCVLMLFYPFLCV